MSKSDKRHQKKLTFNTDRIQGFTLIEIMITLSILIIISQVATPNIHRIIINHTNNSISEKLKYDLSLARNLAVTMNIKIKAIFDTHSWKLVNSKTNEIITENQLKDKNFIINNNDSKTGDHPIINELGIWTSPFAIGIKNNKCQNILTTLSIKSIGSITTDTSYCDQG